MPRVAASLFSPVRTVKFVRWLRTFIYRETGWSDTLIRLAKIYATR